MSMMGSPNTRSRNQKTVISLAVAQALATSVVSFAGELETNAAGFPGAAKGNLASEIRVDSEKDNTVSDRACTLREALENAATPGTHDDCNAGVAGVTNKIFFAPGLPAITLTQGELLIDADVTISSSESQPQIISGNEASRVFSIYSGHTVSLTNLELMRGVSESSGGAIRSNAAQLTLERCALRNNKGADGGAVRHSGSMSIIDSEFQGNESFSAATAFGSGGAVYLSGTDAIVSISGSTFQNNFAESAGGAVITRAFSTNIQQSTFSGNTASVGSGGAIRLSGDGQLTLSLSIVTGNAARRGGGLATTEYDAVLDLDNTVVQFNTATSGVGGGIWSAGSAQIHNSIVDGNSASSSGGGIYLSYDAMGSPALDLVETSISNNTAGSSGGGLRANAPMSIFLGGIDNNNAARGGGLFAASDVTAENTSVSGNSANVSDGGGMEFYSAGNANLLHVSMRNNQAEALGGALAINAGSVSISRSTLQGNGARSGAGISNESGELSIFYTSMVGNIAEFEGGALYLYGVENKIRHSTLSSNKAEFGGAIFAAYGASVTNATFADNQATSGVGASFYVGYPAGTTLRSSVLTGGEGTECKVNGSSFLSDENNFISDDSCTGNASGLQAGDARLGPLTDYDGNLGHPILEGSPLVDAGGQSGCTVGYSDQWGRPRVIDGNADGSAECDIGAIEFIDVYPPTAAIGDMSSAAPSGSVWRFPVEYVETDGQVDAVSFDNDDLIVLGPNGYSESAVFLESSVGGLGAAVTAFYGLAAPGGTWDPSDAGEYRVLIQDEQVFDMAVEFPGENFGPNAIAAGEVGVLTAGFPEISVMGGGVDIGDGDFTPSLADQTDFGDVVIGSSRTRGFLIANVGDAPLSISDFSITGGAFQQATDPQGTLEPGEQVVLQVNFEPAEISTRSATVIIANDDSDESLFDFVIQGTGVAVPAEEIAIYGDGVEIDDGDVTPSVVDGTNFGPIRPGEEVERQFVITNQGNEDLNISSTLQITSAEFSVSQQPQETKLGPQDSTTFRVNFAPSVGGVFEAQVSLANSDADENPYSFTVAGEAVSNQPPVVTDATFSVLLGAPAETVVGQVMATDPDGEIPATGAYEILAGNDENLFGIDDSGVLRLQESPVQASVFELTVTVSDNEGLTGSADILVRIDGDMIFTSDFEF